MKTKNYNATTWKLFWKVTGDHPIAPRKDKFKMQLEDAKIYADELRSNGYENVEVAPDIE